MQVPLYDSLIQSIQEAFDSVPHYSGIALFEMSGNDRMVWQGGYADEVMRTPHTLDTQFSIASLSKQFTAVALLMALTEQGKDLPSALQGTLAFYLPDYDAPWSNQITLHQLLTHTTGLDNYTDFEFEDQIKAINDSPDARNRQIAFIKTFSQNPKKVGIFNYSNTNYHLLYLVIEALTGMMLGDFMAKTIFTPLGMKNSNCFCESTNVALKENGMLTNVALAYLLDPTKPEIEKIPCKDYENYGVSAGDGSVVSTVSDLHKWCEDLFRNNKVISKEISNLICQPRILDPTHSDEEASCWYGYGIGCYDYKNELLNNYWHSGSTYGYTSFMCYFPNLDAIYIKLSNFSEDCFIDSKERDAVRKQYLLDLDESAESEKIITDALEKRYPGHGDRIKCIEPDIVTHLKKYFMVSEPNLKRKL